MSIKMNLGLNRMKKDFPCLVITSVSNVKHTVFFSTIKDRDEAYNKMVQTESIWSSFAGGLTLRTANIVAIQKTECKAKV